MREEKRLADKGPCGNGLKFVKRDLLKVKNAGLITGRNRVVGNHPRERLNSWHYYASTHLQRRPVIGATHQGEHRDSGIYWRREINSSFFDQLHDRHAGKSFRTGVNCEDALD